MKISKLFPTVAALAMVCTPTVLAQQEQQVARQCLDDLSALGQRIQDEGYWLTGWGTRWVLAPGALVSADRALQQSRRRLSP